MNRFEFKYGILKVSDTPDNEYPFLWSGCEIDSQMDSFTETIPVFILTTEPEIKESTIQFVEKIISNINNFLKISIQFLQNVLTENIKEFRVNDDELRYLKQDIENFPVDLPELIFYENNEWMIRFAVGQFNICEPNGIAVYFKSEKAIRVEDLSNTEIID